MNINRILKLFRRKVVTEAEDSLRNSATTTKTSEKKSLKKEIGQNISDSTPCRKESEASIAARKFFETANNHSAVEMKELFTSDCIVYFPDAEMLGLEIADDIARLGKSFPDFTLSYEKIEEVGPNVARIRNVRASGTHTGEPYGFGPYPPIATTGKKVLNDPEETTITINEHTGLITKIKVVPKGVLSGPPGLYQQIGGILF